MLSSMNNICMLLITFSFEIISLVRATSRLPNRFLPFPHGSHVLLGVPHALSRPGAGRPSAQVAERVQERGGAVPACQSRRPCPEAGGARSTPTAPGGSARGARAAREGARREAGRQPRRAPAHWGCFSQSCS